MEPKAILCVDDETVILLSLIQEMKMAFGSRFVYEKATNADDAMEIIDELAEDGIKVILIISDWLMPGIKGDEFLDLVNDKYPNIKAIMITGHAAPDAVERVRNNGSVLGVLRKPWKSEDLTNFVLKASGEETEKGNKNG